MNIIKTLGGLVLIVVGVGLIEWYTTSDLSYSFWKDIITDVPGLLLIWLAYVIWNSEDLSLD